LKQALLQKGKGKSSVRRASVDDSIAFRLTGLVTSPALQPATTIRRHQWVLVGLLLAVGVINILDRNTLAIANKNISADLNLSQTKMGLLLSAFSMAYAFSQLPLGVLLDRIGPRIVLAVGLFVWSTAQLLGGMVTSLWQFMAARIFLGLGEAPTFPAGAKIIANWFNRRARGGPTGIFLASPTIGPALAPPVITGLMIHFGWRSMFMIMGVTGIALSIVWYLLARDRKDVVLTAEEAAYFGKDNEDAAVRRKLTAAEWCDLFLQPTTWGIVFGFVGVIYMIWLYLTWLPGYLEHERNLSVARVGWVVSIPYLFGMLGSVSCGYAADYLVRHGVSDINSRKWPICVGLLGAAGFTVPVAYTPDNTMAVVYLCVVMFFLYMASGGAWALVNAATPNHMIATVGGLQNFGGYFVGSLAPVITGWLAEHTHSFKTALMLSSLVAFVAALIYFVLVKEPIRDMLAAPEFPDDEHAPAQTRDSRQA
jgi:MFS family permease